jgi:hypothetical protein
MKEMDFSTAVNVIVRHVEGATGDVPPRRLDAALIRVLPSLRDIAEELKAYNRSAGQQRRRLAVQQPGTIRGTDDQTRPGE